MYTNENICRVCLTNENDAIVGNIDYIHVCEVYERITGETFLQHDNNTSICYICLRFLEKCSKFIKTAQKVNKILSNFSKTEIEVKQTKEFREKHYLHKFSKITLENINILPNIYTENTTDKPLTNSQNSKFEIGITTSKKHKMNIKTEKRSKNIKRNKKMRNTISHEEFNTKSSINKNALTCDICSYTCKKKIQLFRHMKFHNLNKKTTCDLCQYRFKNTEDLNLHECVNKTNIILNKINVKMSDSINKNQVNIKKVYSCLKCEFNSLNKKDIIKHRRSHAREKYKPFLCHFCDFKCTEKRGLSYHIRTHTGEKPFSCNLCLYKCSTKGSLDRHMKVHTGEKPFSCNVCDYRCAESDSLKKHMRTHTGEKPFSCHICDFKCKVKSNLNVHLKFHTGEKPFSCEICDYKCTQSSALKMHVVRMHRDKKQPLGVPASVK